MNTDPIPEGCYVSGYCPNCLCDMWAIEYPNRSIVDDQCLACGEIYFLDGSCIDGAPSHCFN